MNRITALLMLLLGLVTAGVTHAGSTTPPPLKWDKASNHLDISVVDWKLDRLLKELSKETKWQVYVEPRTSASISAKFKDLPMKEALSRLLRDVNYAVVHESKDLTKLLIYRTKPEFATQRILTEEEEKAAEADRLRIDNELVVTLKKGASIEALAARYGAKVVSSIPELGIYRLQFADAEKAAFAKDQLANFNEVQGVDYNYTVPQPTTAQLSVGSSSLPFSLNPVAASSGKGVVVGLVDTAVQSLGSSMDQFLLKSIYAAGDPATDSSTLNHGTSMAETILRALASSSDSSSSSIKILPVDVFGQNASTTTYDVAYGIYLAVQGGANVINLSLGSTATASYLEQLIANSSAQGVIFLGAAGNEPTSSATYPAAYSQVIAVTAGDRSGDIASYANYGDFVDVVAPGSVLVSFNGKTYIVSGTSASTAEATGIAAQLKSITQASSDQIKSKLMELWPRKN